MKEPLSILSKLNYSEKNEDISGLRRKQAKYFRSRVKSLNLNVANKLPCALPFVENMNKLVLNGESKLKQEWKFA